MNATGFTPRADKGKIGHGGGGSWRRRFAAKDLPAGDNWSQTARMQKRVTFHKGSGALIHLCANVGCRKHDVRHWHRECPNGAKGATSDHFGNLSLDDIENDLLAEKCQVAVEEKNDVRCDALCMLAGGKPKMVDDVSEFSFGVAREDAPGFVLTRDGSTQSVVSDEDTPRPVDPLHAHEPDMCFADRIAQMGGFSITSEGHQFSLNHMHVEADDVRDDVINGDDAGCATAHRRGSVRWRRGIADDVARLCACAQECGKPPMGFGRSSAIALLVCAFSFVFTPPSAAPLPVAAVGSVNIDGHAAPPVGGSSAGSLAMY
ncbi:hypothetical protein CYMTET_56746 [Cymbomonas tetramitiformis]|uniref:Uncharacterized protein n=1 Tax=Cymbomonas tetramitiformis TaxID=36881 RepID=A0AAE0EM00_9CHLO|nr:hypothetical protein CYMTET_56746 [Cymbomonas tetramitiformis]